MPRPRKRRNVQGIYEEYYFKPRGVALSGLQQVDLTFDEIESLKYVDLEGIGMDEAATRMEISKPTLCRMVNGARKKVADALINGKAIELQNYHLTNNTMPNRDGTGPQGKGPRTGRGMGNCAGSNSGSGAGGAANRRGMGMGRGMGRGAGKGTGRGRG